MSSVKSRTLNKLLSVLLSVIMAFTILPYSLTVSAATEEHPDCVTITVMDEERQPIKDASVEFTIDSKSKGDSYINNTLQTDGYGVVEILKSSDFVSGDMTVTATVTAESFGEKKITDSVISEADQNFEIILSSTTVPDVAVTPTSVKYDGQEHDAAVVTGLKETDEVTYKLNENEPVEEMPQIEEPGVYSLTVTVKREGFDPYTETVNPEIVLNNMELKVTEYTAPYDGQEHPALTVEGLLATDKVTYRLNDGEAQESIPQISDVGSYKVSMQVERHGYEIYERDYTDISITALEIEGLSAEAYTGTYDENEHPAVTVTGTESGDIIEYKLDDGEWQENVPMIRDAGTYKVQVRVSRKNYATTDVQVLPANAFIEKKKQSITFAAYVADGTESIVLSSNGSENIYDFSAESGSETANAVIYNVANASDNGQSITDIASIGQNGILTVKGAGYIKVTASKAGNNNYADTSVSYYLFIKERGDVSFTEQNLEYIIGQNGGVVSEQKAEKADDYDNGILTYSIEGGENNCGLEIEPATGKVTVDDYGKLGQTIQDAENNVLTVFVHVDKSPGTISTPDGTEEIFSEAEAIYAVDISFMDAPSDPAYTLSPSEPGNQYGWYNTEVTVLPTGGYTVVKDSIPASVSAFSDSVTFDNQGDDTRYIYLRDIMTGGITDKIPVDTKIDTQRPETEKMKIEIPQLLLVEKIGMKFGFFDPSVEIKFIIEDETGVEESGIDYVEWFYTKDATATSSILAEKTGTLPVVLEEGKYVATLTLTADEAAQFRGHVSFKAYDKAGNDSAEIKSIEYEEGQFIDDAVIVVDTINPRLISADFKLVDEENGIYQTETIDGVTQHYFSGTVDFTFTIDEANFFEDDVRINITKDGRSFEAEPVWSVSDTDDEVHFGRFTLNEDGDYVVSMSYKDPTDTDEEAITYTSEVITVDTEIPELGFEFDKETQKIKFTVNEENFRSKDISVTGTIEDINGNAVEGFSTDQLTSIVQAAEWVQNGDIYTYETDLYINNEYIDGIYDLKIDYKDKSANAARTIEPEDFVIDHEKPYDIKIEYDEEKSLGETVLETLTLGFYEPGLTVTFTAYDTSAGIESFTWDYTQEAGTSTVNRPTDDADKIARQVIEAKQDANNKSKFTGTITLPEKEAEQLRGYISVVATDRYGNTSDKVADDGYILVVDSISPTMNVEYSREDNRVGNTAYYKGDATITFNVNEANFFAEDVIVSVSKDGGDAVRVNPVWEDQTEDQHIGTYTLSGDGDYTVSVEYKDRSGNGMESYTSHPITIDTIAPVIDVDYRNTDVINTLGDREGHRRQYFSDTQTAEITVTEHNFDAEEVALYITAEDVAGNALDVNSLNRKTVWSSDGDKHTITITYPGDANYSFDIAYSDLARNEAENYEPDYFTVDKTQPENLQINYSTSVLDTVLGVITFGFYDSKMTVTVTAEDDISGVHSFFYSYVKADGVSPVNTELRNQTLAEENGDISYSSGGRRAAASFEIPRSALNRNNQFNGNVEFTAADRSENETGLHRGTRRIVVDNIAPTAQISYNEATNVVDGISYYNGNINATITVNEANFYSEDVQVMVSRDGGGSTAVTPRWTDSSTDVHIGTFTLSEDGDYIITVNYSDKSSNRMETYTSGQMTIDTQIEEPVFSINGVEVTGEGGAYKNDALIAFSYEDENFASENITLSRTRFDSVEDVTDEFITVSGNDRGGEGNFTIPEEVENDGIYILNISITDKANHTTEAQLQFSINRYGSVYVYDDYLMSLIKDGGQYITIEGDNETAVTEDLIITEYNADRLMEDSLDILVTRDGEALDVDYTTNPVNINNQTEIGESGWYQYEYSIKASNFSEDGVYRIALSSAYAANDSERNESTSVPENSIDENGNQVLDSMNFTVDTTAPEIRNIVNLDEAIVNAQNLDVDYTVVDVGGLESIEIILNGETTDEIMDFGDDAFNYSDQFTIRESSEAQSVRIKAVDRAGNITDTASEDFSTGGLYTFNDSIVVSTNFFVRWYANKPLFWGSIAGVIVVAGGLIFIIAAKRKKKEEEKEQ